jgi:hypothetical protein
MALSLISSDSAEGRRHEKPTGKILKNISEDAFALLQAEFDIFQHELRSLLPRAEKDMQRALLFVTISALSALPFLAFLVIGLGELLNQRYWLSSLIVAVLCFAIFKPLARKSYYKLTRQNFHFIQTKQALMQGLNAVQAKMKDVAQAATEATPQGDQKYDEYQVH